MNPSITAQMNEIHRDELLAEAAHRRLVAQAPRRHSHRHLHIPASWRRGARARSFRPA